MWRGPGWRGRRRRRGGIYNKYRFSREHAAAALHARSFSPAERIRVVCSPRKADNEIESRVRSCHNRSGSITSKRRERSKFEQSRLDEWCHKR